MQETRTYPVSDLRIRRGPRGYSVVDRTYTPVCDQIFSPEALVEELVEALALPSKTAAYAALRHTMPGADQLFRVASPEAIDPDTVVTKIIAAAKRDEAEYSRDIDAINTDRERARDAGIDFDALSRCMEGANSGHVLFRSVRRAMATDVPWTSTRVAHASTAQLCLRKIADRGGDPDIVVKALLSVSMCPLTLAGKLSSSKRRRDTTRARLESIRDRIKDLDRRIGDIIKG